MHQTYGFVELFIEYSSVFTSKGVIYIQTGPGSLYLPPPREKKK